MTIRSEDLTMDINFGKEAENGITGLYNTREGNDLIVRTTHKMLQSQVKGNVQYVTWEALFDVANKEEFDGDIFTTYGIIRVKDLLFLDEGITKEKGIEATLINVSDVVYTKKSALRAIKKEVRGLRKKGVKIF